MKEKRFKQVKASAGSGKTHNLIGRYLSYLARCAYGDGSRRNACSYRDDELSTYGMDEILAITFTNTAAGEMRDRVISSLKKTALEDASQNPEISPERASQWLDRIIRDLRRLNIRTIDSLMHHIARASALELGLNPDFRPEFATSRALEPYLESFMDEARDNEALETLLREACKALIDQKSRSFRPKNRVADGVKALLDDALRDKFKGLANKEEIREKLLEIRSDMAASARALLDVCDSSDMIWNKTSRDAVAKLADANGPTPGGVPACLKKDPDALKKKDSRVPSGAAKIYGELAEKVARFYKLSPLLEDALIRQPLAKISALVAEAFKRRMAREAAVPAALIPHKANKILLAENGVSDAVCRLGTRLSHIFIDEFQDTSDDQWESLRPLALEAMSRGGDFVYVGDVKQSIYGFRSGNARLFEKITTDKPLVDVAGGVERQILDENWRSGKNIIEFNNRLFGVLENPEDAETVLRKTRASGPDALFAETAKLLSENYKDCAQKVSKRPRPEGMVRGLKLEEDASEQLDEAILRELGNTAEEIHSRRRRWSDTLVLVRSNKQAARAAAELISRGAPVITENSLLLKDNPLVAQSAAFLAFLSNPADDASFWAVLNGSIFLDHPFVASRLDRERLNEWALSRSGEPLCSRFVNDFPELANKFFKPFLDASQSGAKNGAPLLAAPYDMIMEWYARTNAEKRFPNDETFIRAFMEIVYAAEENGRGALSDFIEFWKEREEEAKAPMPSGMDAVRIMTIHKAKGLEAPVVIVPWTNFSAKAKMRISIENVDGLIIPYNSGARETGEPYDRYIMGMLLEHINLLYVAFTRPREELHFFVGQTRSANRTSADGLEKMIELAGFTLPLAIGEAPESKDGKKKEERVASAEIVPARRETDDSIATDWRPMSWMPGLRVARPSRDEESFTSENRGIFIHYCLERLKFSEDPEADVENAFHSGLYRCPIRIPDDEETLRDARIPLNWARSAPEIGEWLKDGIFEQSLVDENGEESRADLIVPEDDGYLVIDFKTGGEYARHEEQIKKYIKLLKSVYPEKNIRGKLVYVDLKKIKSL